MSKNPQKLSGYQKDFDEIYQMIVDAQSKTWSVINTQLIQLYWSIGQYIFNKTTNDKWGKSTVEALAEYIHQHHLPARGFSARNIWRMKQFYENYEDTKLSTVMTEI